MAVLWRRSSLIRAAIASAVSSAIFSAALILNLFISISFHLETAWLVVGLFSGSMLTLIGSLAFFFLDISLSLTALKLELGDLTHSLRDRKRCGSARVE